MNFGLGQEQNFQQFLNGPKQTFAIFHYALCMQSHILRTDDHKMKISTNYEKLLTML